MAARRQDAALPHDCRGPRRASRRAGRTAGPTVQENYGKATPAPTFQDLLRNPHDEKLYEYYATTQLTLINSATGRVASLGKPAIFGSVEPAPDGDHFLVARSIARIRICSPQGRSRDWSRFGIAAARASTNWQICRWPIRFRLQACRRGRAIAIAPTESATLVWVEALDGGDSRKKASPRDVVKMLKAPFTGPSVELTKTEHRFAGMTWGEKDGLVFVGDSDRIRRRSRMFMLNADNASQQPTHPRSLTARSLRRPRRSPDETNAERPGRYSSKRRFHLPVRTAPRMKATARSSIALTSRR